MYTRKPIKNSHYPVSVHPNYSETEEATKLILRPTSVDSPSPPLPLGRRKVPPLRYSSAV